MRRYEIEIYSDIRKQYRWRLRVVNGRIIADSGESYASKANARRAVRSLLLKVAFAKVVYL